MYITLAALVMDKEAKIKIGKSRVIRSSKQSLNVRNIRGPLFLLNGGTVQNSFGSSQKLRKSRQEKNAEYVPENKLKYQPK